jgi:hypothetical protein
MQRGKGTAVRVFLALTCVGALAYAVDHYVWGRGGARIVLYGDSLAMQSAQDFQYLGDAAHATTFLAAYSGIAICDILPRLASDTDSFHPTVAVLEFSGNDLTPCMRGYKVGSPAYIKKYEQDAHAAVTTLRHGGVRVILAGAPEVANARLSYNVTQLNTMYTVLAASIRGASYVDAGQSVLARGRFAWTLPCLPSEPCNGAAGTNVVRSPDGIHFCPTGRTTIQGPYDLCDVYSSGAYRFATAMLVPALRTPALPI